MPVLPTEILKEINQKKFRPVYFVHGDEPFFIDAIADALEQKVLTEAEKGFNQFVLFGKDHDIGSVMNYARKYPFMAEDRKSTRLNSSHSTLSRMPSSA